MNRQKQSGQLNTRPKEPAPYKIYAVFISCAVLLAALACILWIVLWPSRRQNPGGGFPTACIYQDGVLVESIPLEPLASPYTFTVTGGNGCFNEITVKEGCIGVTAASCPDKLCMRQGFIKTPLLPVTCLPNRLVIQIEEPETGGGNNPSPPDVISY